MSFFGATGAVLIRSPALYSPSNATVLGLIKTLPYNVSVFAVNALLVPYRFDLMASETRPPLGLNITNALLVGHNFNVVASMLLASGVVEEFEADEGGARITLFVPVDTAFANLEHRRLPERPSKAFGIPLLVRPHHGDPNDVQWSLNDFSLFYLGLHWPLNDWDY